MKQAIEKVWSNLGKECERAGLHLNQERATLFEERFREHYQTTMTRFMSKGTTTLDIHKQVAIIVISALEAQVVEQKGECGESEIKIGPYVVALNVALSHLEDYINDRLRGSEYQGEKVDLSMPTALACNTPYFEIMCRLLYYQDPNQPREGSWSYSILEWADRFYLLEYITLLEAGINPIVYKEICQQGNE